MKHSVLVLLSLTLVACNMAPSKPVVDFSSENSISLRYKAYDKVPTVSAEAIDVVSKHCGRFSKGWKLLSSKAVQLSTEEIHTFMCTNDFTDERIEIKVR